MRIIKQLTNNRFLNLKEVSDDSMGCKGYQFAERLGVDSIAFICYDKSKNEFIINNECTPPIGKLLKRAFGGSLDKNKEMEKIVKAEVEEEVGYNVDDSDINMVGKCFVSTQMNQFCYLYLVFISDKKKTERKPENESEAISHPIVVLEEEIEDGDDWKAITILTKARKLKLI
jgi:UDP-sugar diphosphatase